ncbi:uncharacterized protein FIBRA_03345 [Fibroporia radiculosa]|uniref:Uncharacterized protein n=1 Tax=Fibroporia radiculosa TaxID=599839 RepID=J4I9K0_9APHY|nr:uncharacterized protein FIBRA_03345 [Fibroporia radiculosa]CCM01296.1 predicted protein [Fibroporia radiculosa]
MTFPKFSFSRPGKRSATKGVNPVLTVIDNSLTQQYTVKLPLFVPSTSQPTPHTSHRDVAEMLDEDDCAWGSPPRRSKRSKSRC